MGKIQLGISSSAHLRVEQASRKWAKGKSKSMKDTREKRPSDLHQGDSKKARKKPPVDVSFARGAMVRRWAEEEIRRLFR
ncbi:unnamed protein product [Cuscuta campestris]|uniref:Uncharacterized protein n=1 Tax=Cuscuta campestris TaxID=132261 RepID=A0A484N7A1_9ASTE|nr:unnamed protein product [Cuscuta campestris]